MTALPAQMMGLDSKGVLRPEMDTDLVVFDPHTVRDRATFDEPERYPLGIEHVIIDGTPVVKDEESTDARLGTVIRE